MSTFIGQFDYELADVAWFDPLFFMLCWYDEDLISFEQSSPPRRQSQQSAGRDGIDAYQRWLAAFNADLAQAEDARLALRHSDLPSDVVDEALSELRQLMMLAHPDKWQGSEQTASEFTARLSALRDKLSAARGETPHGAPAIGTAPGERHKLKRVVQHQISGRSWAEASGVVQFAIAGGAFALVLALGPVGGLLMLAGGVLALLLSASGGGSDRKRSLPPPDDETPE